jgi:hypothetical protein
VPLPPNPKKRAGPLATPEEVRLHLIASAEAGRPITYSELLEQLGYRFSRPKMRQLCAILSAVDEETEVRGEPELAVLVVRQSDGIPGQGWWVAQARSGAGYSGRWEGAEAAAFVACLQAQAFAFWQCHSGTGSKTQPD